MDAGVAEALDEPGPLNGDVGPSAGGDAELSHGDCAAAPGDRVGLAGDGVAVEPQLDAGRAEREAGRAGYVAGDVAGQVRVLDDHVGPGDETADAVLRQGRDGRGHDRGQNQSCGGYRPRSLRSWCPLG